MKLCSFIGEIVGDYYYGIGNQMNVIVRIDLKTHHREVICIPIKNENEWNSFSYMSSLLIDDDIWFFPHTADDVLIFNVKNYDVKSIKIMNYTVQKKFFNGVLYDSKIFLIPFEYPAIVSIEISSHEVEYYDVFPENVKHLTTKNFFIGGDVVNGKLIMIPAEQPYLVQFDLIEKKMCTIGRVDNPNSYGFPIRVDDIMWVFPYSFTNHILKIEAGNVEKIKTSEAMSGENGNSPSSLDNCIYIPSKDGRNINIFDISKKKYIEMKVEFNDSKYTSRFFSHKRKDNTLYYFTEDGEYFIKINGSNIEVIDIVDDTNWDLQYLMLFLE